IKGLRKGSGGFFALTRASLISAQNPAQTGALQLVPPICCTLPFSTTNAPLLGSAARLTSGTSRLLPAGTPLPFCHGGRGKKMLVPPPLPVHPTSLATVPFAASVSVVPPTPITLGSDDSYSACRGPPALWPVTSGFEPASPLDTKTF